MFFDDLDFFISPLTGKMKLGKGLIYMGDENNIGQQSDIIQKIQDEIDKIKPFPDDAKFVLLEPDKRIPNAFALNSLSDGVVFMADGKVTTKTKVALENLPELKKVTIANLPSPAPQVYAGTSSGIPEVSNVLGEMMAEALLAVNRLTAPLVMISGITNAIYPSATFIKDEGIVLYRNKKFVAAVGGTDFVDVEDGLNAGKLCVIKDNSKFIGRTTITIVDGEHIRDVLSVSADVLNAKSAVNCEDMIVGRKEVVTDGILAVYDPSLRLTLRWGFKGPRGLARDLIYTPPNKDGNDGDCLATDGNLNLKWVKSGSAISDATFILNTPYSGMDKAQALSELGGGIAKVEATTGKISIAKAGKGLTDDYVDPNALKEALDEKDEEFKKIKEDCEKARDDAKEAKDKAEEAKTKVDETKEKIDEIKTQLDEKIDEFKTELDEAKTQIEEAQAACEEAQAACEEAQATAVASAGEATTAAGEASAAAEEASDAAGLAAGSATAAAGSAAAAAFLIGDVKNKEDKSSHKHDIEHLQSQIDGLVPVSVVGTPNETLVIPNIQDKKLIYTIHLDSTFKTNADKSIAFVNNFDITAKSPLIINKQDTKYEITLDGHIIQPKLIFNNTEEITIQQEQGQNNEINLRFFIDKDFKKLLLTDDKLIGTDKEVTIINTADGKLKIGIDKVVFDNFNKQIVDNLDKINLISKNDSLIITKGEPYVFNLEVKQQTTIIQGKQDEITVTIDDKTKANIIGIDNKITDKFKVISEEIVATNLELTKKINANSNTITNISSKLDDAIKDLNDGLNQKLDGVEVRQVIIEVLKEYKLIP